MLRQKALYLLSFALILGLILRALLPTGFMPDLLAAQQGLFKITICAANGTQNVFVDNQMQPHAPQTAQHKLCDFALSQQHGWLVITIGVLSLLFRLWQKVTSVTTITNHVSRKHQEHAAPRGPPAL